MKTDINKMLDPILKDIKNEKFRENLKELMTDFFNEIVKIFNPPEKPESSYRFKVGDEVYFYDFFLKKDSIEISKSHNIKVISLDPTCHKTETELEKYWVNLELKHKIITRLNELNGDWVADYLVNNNQSKYFIVFKNGKYVIDAWHSSRVNNYPAKSRDIWQQIINELGNGDINKIAEALEL